MGYRPVIAVSRFGLDLQHFSEKRKGRQIIGLGGRCIIHSDKIRAFIAFYEDRVSEQGEGKHGAACNSNCGMAGKYCCQHYNSVYQQKADYLQQHGLYRKDKACSGDKAS